MNIRLKLHELTINKDLFAPAGTDMSKLMVRAVFVSSGIDDEIQRAIPEEELVKLIYAALKRIEIPLDA